MVNLDYIIKGKVQEHNPNWQQIPDNPCKILITGGSGSGKTNALFNLICHQTDIDKTYLYAKDPFKAKYQLLMNKNEAAGYFKYCKDSKAFIEYSTSMDDIYRNNAKCNPDKERKTLIVFYYMTVDMFSNKKLNPIVIELFIRDRKLKISLVLITQSYFAVPKKIRLD